MGRECCWKGQLIYLLIACLALGLSACAALNESGARPAQQYDAKREAKPRVETEEESRARTASRHILLAKRLLEQGDIDNSIRESQRVIAASGRTVPSDEALFTIGLAHVHHKNPRKDYERSLGYFVRLIREYPQSALVDQARTWIEVLQVIEKLKKVDKEIEEKKKELSK